jgi:hypothetical protein
MITFFSGLLSQSIWPFSQIPGFVRVGTLIAWTKLSKKAFFQRWAVLAALDTITQLSLKKSPK